MGGEYNFGIFSIEKGGTVNQRRFKRNFVSEEGNTLPFRHVKFEVPIGRNFRL